MQLSLSFRPDRRRELEKLVGREQDRLYRFALFRTGSDEDAQDLVQEVLINLWKGFERFEGRSDIRTWVYRVSLNTCISSARKKKIGTLPLTLDLDLFDESDSENRQINLLHERITRLQPFDRAIVLLWLENLSYDEIGKIVGISTKNVSVRLIRIKEQLKAMSND